MDTNYIGEPINGPLERPEDPAGDARIDAALDAARLAAGALRARWDAIYRAAICAAAQAIQARDWNAKRQALAVADQASSGRDAMIVSIFGARDIPAQYRALEDAGAQLTRQDSSAALAIIAADRRATQQRRKAR